ncbi:MAG: PEP-CTERM sorting domain-containing protein [Algisphaera sp.]
MNNLVNKSKTLVAAAAFCAMASPALAADILYGDFAGTTVNYGNVREDVQGLFGTPTISGDSLSFTPLEFTAESIDGGIDFTDGTLAFNVMPTTAGHAISGLTLEESGAFDLVGSGTDATRVAIAVVFSINVLEVDNAPYVGASQVIHGSTIFEANLIDSPGLGQAWQASAYLDIAALANAQHDITGKITKAAVVLDNKLLAISESGTLAFIDKKNVDAVIITIPEPTTVAIIGLGSLCFVARRRRSA